MPWNLERLQKRCLDNIESFYDEGQLYETAKKEQYIWRDTGSPILAVAHLDSVQGTNHFHAIIIDGETIVYNGQLDDRLGAYVILDLLPELGIQCDILLTTGEEHGQSTARYFYPEPYREYNWIFSFDRGGTDVVMYQYETPALNGLLTASGMHVGIGSYSDIADLEDLGVAGFNFGVGYQDYHSSKAHVDLEDLRYMVERFVHFYNLNWNKQLPYVPDKTKTRGYWNTRYLDYGGYGLHESDVWEYDEKTQDFRPSVEDGGVESGRFLGHTHEPLDQEQILDSLIKGELDKDDVTECEVCGEYVLNEDYSFTYGSCFTCYKEITASEDVPDDIENSWEALKAHENALYQQEKQALDLPEILTDLEEGTTDDRLE